MYIGDFPPPDSPDESGFEVDHHSPEQWAALLAEFTGKRKGKTAAPTITEADPEIAAIDAEIEPTPGELAAGKQVGLGAEAIRAAKLNQLYRESEQRLQERGLFDWMEE
jgi:hypothetical protein